MSHPGRPPGSRRRHEGPTDPPPEDREVASVRARVDRRREELEERLARTPAEPDAAARERVDEVRARLDELRRRTRDGVEHLDAGALEDLRAWLARDRASDEPRREAPEGGSGR